MLNNKPIELERSNFIYYLLNQDINNIKRYYKWDKATVLSYFEYSDVQKALFVLTPSSCTLDRVFDNYMQDLWRVLRAIYKDSNNEVLSCFMQGLMGAAKGLLDPDYNKASDLDHIVNTWYLPAIGRICSYGLETIGMYRFIGVMDVHPDARTIIGPNVTQEAKLEFGNLVHKAHEHYFQHKKDMSSTAKSY